MPGPVLQLTGEEEMSSQGSPALPFLARGLAGGVHPSANTCASAAPPCAQGVLLQLWRESPVLHGEAAPAGGIPSAP